eukprot:SAG31_NODE_1660_length_7599_cov_3.194800_8_plen_182_part_00
MLAWQVTFDARNQQLVFAPARELKQLRTHLTSTITRTTTQSVQLNASSASDSELWFARPRPGVAFQVTAGGMLLAANFSYHMMQFCQGVIAVVGSKALPPPPQCVELSLYQTDVALDVRVLADEEIMEVYVLGGRAALAFQAPKSVGGIAIGASTHAQLLNASSWAVGSIKTTVEDVLSRR